MLETEEFFQKGVDTADNESIKVGPFFLKNRTFFLKNRTRERASLEGEEAPRGGHRSAHAPP